MYTIEGEAINKLEINKSIFITYIKHVETITDAKAYLDSLKVKHPDATHHVSGYIIGKKAENGHYTDDGEPSGTAGMPMFEVLRKNELTNIVIDIVRYFGGVKLGAGGLVRAYAKSASEIIKLKGIVPIIDYSYFTITFDYSFLKTIEKSFTEEQIIKKEFHNQVTFNCKVPKSNLSNILLLLKNATSNLAKIEILNEE